MQILHGRKALEELHQTGLYVSHGSPDPGIDKFVPRKPLSRAENNNKPIVYEDNQIFATDYIDVAIFVAVVFHAGNSGWYTDISTNPVTFTFNADQETVRKAKNSVGYVYVFRKDQFEQNKVTRYEYITTHEVAPVYCVEVSSSDVRPALDTLKPDPDKSH